MPLLVGTIFVMLSVWGGGGWDSNFCTLDDYNNYICLEQQHILQCCANWHFVIFIVTGVTLLVPSRVAPPPRQMISSQITYCLSTVSIFRYGETAFCSLTAAPCRLHLQNRLALCFLCFGAYIFGYSHIALERLYCGKATE